MNLSGTQRDLLHRTLDFISGKMVSAAIGLIFWAAMIALISCPVWVPIVVERIGH